MRRAAAALLLGLFVAAPLVAPGPLAAEPVSEPDDYRADNFRSTTPATLKGARVVSTAEAEEIWKGGGAVFVDVLPQPPRPKNLPAGTIWHERPRLNIPGSIWLPDTGYGALAAPMEDYLRANLARLTGGDPGKMLVVYCLRDCWMSWNAAKRALAMGYRNVVWYPDGTDGWEDALLTLAVCKPEPRPGE
jgi:PQQ-dependent catabolism-associated CXXCW motif protein